jgi:hypothetical protein
MDGWDDSFQMNDEGFLDFLSGFERITQQGRLEQHPLVRTSLLHLTVDALECSRPFCDTLGVFTSVCCDVGVSDDIQSTKFSRVSQQENNVHLLRPRVADKKNGIWELLEFYGPTAVSFTVREKGMFHSSVLAEGFIQLGTLMRHQERVYAVRKSSQPANSDEAPPNISPSDAIKRWDIECVLCLTPKDVEFCKPKSSNSSSDGKLRLYSGGYDSKLKMHDTSEGDTDDSCAEFKLKFRFRILTLTSCNQLDSVFCSSKFGRSNSELQFAVEHGRFRLVEEMLASLSQNSLLKQSLALKNSGYYNVFCLALLTRNKEMVRLLLKRCGIWCFQDTGQVRYVMD